MLLLEGAGCQREEQPSGSDKEEVKIKVLTRDEVDTELLQMWSMDKEAAEALAMRAMAEAEAIMAEAEAAAKEAESAEAEAEAAQAFADAASTTIRSRHATKLVSAFQSLFICANKARAKAVWVFAVFIRHRIICICVYVIVSMN